jgi:hypothetical protein
VIWISKCRKQKTETALLRYVFKKKKKLAGSEGFVETKIVFSS